METGRGFQGFFEKLSLALPSAPKDTRRVKQPIILSSATTRAPVYFFSQKTSANQRSCILVSFLFIYLSTLTFRSRGLSQSCPLAPGSLSSQFINNWFVTSEPWLAGARNTGTLQQQLEMRRFISSDGMLFAGRVCRSAAVCRWDRRQLRVSESALSPGCAAVLPGLSNCLDVKQWGKNTCITKATQIKLLWTEAFTSENLELFQTEKDYKLISEHLGAKHFTCSLLLGFYFRLLSLFQHYSTLKKQPAYALYHIMSPLFPHVI